MSKPVHHILLVDDLNENIFSLENMLAEEGRVFHKATNGNDALKIVHTSEISLILLDVQMPGMDGFVTANFLKANSKTRKIPIVFVTAIQKDQEYVVKGLSDSGAIDYLFKPLDIDVTRAKVSNLLLFYDQQKELERKNAELSILNEEKNKLLGIAAHDLRNPLSSIMMLSKFILKNTNHFDEEQLKMLNMIKAASTYMLNLVESLLDVSKIEMGQLDLERSSSDVVQLLNDIIEMNSFISVKKNIQLRSDLVLPEHLIMNIDSVKMRQVFNNLISNAVKFSDEGNDVMVHAHLKDKQVEISVIDHGRGIPESELHKLFKFFSKTTTKSTDGERNTGLGLAISHKIVEAHGGHIFVNSKVGEGSTFTVQLDVQ